MASPASSVAARERFTVAQARRIALAAQGFTDPKPSTPTTRHLQRVIDRVGIMQVDSVNVLTRSSATSRLFSRLGPYDYGLLDRARDHAPRRLVEYWAHDASLIPPSTIPLLRWRMDRWRDEAWGGMRSVQRDHADVVKACSRRWWPTARSPLVRWRADWRTRRRGPATSGAGTGRRQGSPRAPVLGGRSARPAATPSSNAGTPSSSGCSPPEVHATPTVADESEAFRSS